MTAAHSHSLNLPERDGKPCPGAPHCAVGETLRRADREQWLADQYRRDLEVIERCERDVEEQGGCPDFFGCMGKLQRLQREPETGAQ